MLGILTIVSSQEEGRNDRDNAKAGTRARTAARTMAAAVGHPVLREHRVPDPQAPAARRRHAHEHLVRRPDPQLR